MFISSSVTNASSPIPTIFAFNFANTFTDHLFGLTLSDSTGHSFASKFLSQANTTWFVSINCSVFCWPGFLHSSGGGFLISIFSKQILFWTSFLGSSIDCNFLFSDLLTCTLLSCVLHMFSVPGVNFSGSAASNMDLFLVCILCMWGRFDDNFLFIFSNQYDQFFFCVCQQHKLVKVSLQQFHLCYSCFAWFPFFHFPFSLSTSTSLCALCVYILWLQLPPEKIVIICLQSFSSKNDCQGFSLYWKVFHHGSLQ